MSDQITLYRKIDNEPLPRFYTLTGADFQAMLAAVKGLGFRTFDANLKAWMVRGDAIKTLKDQGYDVKERPALRTSEPVLSQGVYFVEDNRQVRHAVVTIEQINQRNEYVPVKYINFDYDTNDDLAAKVRAIKDKVAAARKALYANQTRTKDAWQAAIAGLK